MTKKSERIKNLQARIMQLEHVHRRVIGLIPAEPNAAIDIIVEVLLDKSITMDGEFVLRMGSKLKIVPMSVADRADVYGITMADEHSTTTAEEQHTIAEMLRDNDDITWGLSGGPGKGKSAFIDELEGYSPCPTCGAAAKYGSK